MYFPILINRTSQISKFRAVGSYFSYYSNFKTNSCLQTAKNKIKRRVFALSDLVFHSLPMSHKKDTKLIWVKCMREEVISLWLKIVLYCIVCTDLKKKYV